jgi:hypothetical protein
MTQTCFPVNKSFESDSGDVRGANGWDNKMGKGLLFERLFTRGSLRQTSVPLPGGLIKTPEGGRSADTENREKTMIESQARVLGGGICITEVDS